MLKQIWNKKLFILFFILLLLFLNLSIDDRNTFLYVMTISLCYILKCSWLLLQNSYWRISVHFTGGNQLWVLQWMLANSDLYYDLIMCHIWLLLLFFLNRLSLKFKITKTPLIHYCLIFLFDLLNTIFLIILILFLHAGICAYHSINILWVVFLFIWVRAAFPRYRYDQLSYISWKQSFRLILGLFSSVVGLLIFGLIFHYYF